MEASRDNFQTGPAKVGSILSVRCPPSLMDHWEMPTATQQLGWLTLITRRIIHINKKKELTIEADLANNHNIPGIQIQLTLSNGKAWELFQDDGANHERQTNEDHPHNQIGYVIWRPFPDLTETKIAEITKQFTSPSTDSDTGSIISFTSETSVRKSAT